MSRLQHLMTLKAGLPAEHAPAMRDLVEEFQDIFRIRLDDSRPADVPPMGVEFQPHIKPSKAPPRHYSPRKRSFISTYCDKLLTNKLAVTIKTSDWVSPPLLVKKDPPAYFRITLDLRGPNYASRRHEFFMTNLEEELAKLAGAKYFAKLYFAQGFWQLPTDWEAALLFEFRGVDGLYASTRVPHGVKNSAQWFQLVTLECFKELLYCLRQWIDDFLIHTKIVQGLLEVLRQFFEIYRKKRFKLHAVKCDLFGTKAESCGRTISQEGIKFNSKSLSGLVDMERPQTAADLQQFVCGSNWPRTSVPNYAQLADPVLQMLRRCCSLARQKLGTRHAFSPPHWEERT
jgi:Reverse transcriptase (RNA-dependent DNA polymerase)